MELSEIEIPQLSVDEDKDPETKVKTEETKAFLENDRISDLELSIYFRNGVVQGLKTSPLFILSSVLTSIFGVGVMLHGFYSYCLKSCYSSALFTVSLALEGYFFLILSCLLMIFFAVSIKTKRIVILVIIIYIVLIILPSNGYVLYASALGFNTIGCLSSNIGLAHTCILIIFSVGLLVQCIFLLKRINRYFKDVKILDLERRLL
eukprot:TRINITY_DN11730_c0_g1_i1.p1 TRINITY_DN11730_c0_g1~~TRINITY_DN11730_c0_g1_i1.p1  ORF type:complete len:206 (-),score=29.15 TRINITY_DN11730_c0_g1_i1:62-679(-)